MTDLLRVPLDWLLGLAFAHPLVVLGLFGVFHLIGRMARIGRRAGYTLLGIGIVAGVIGLLWKKRRDVGAGLLVMIVGGTALAWLLAVLYVPSLRWRLILPVIGVTLVAVAVWIEDTVPADKSLPDAVGEWIEARWNRAAIAGAVDGANVSKGKRVGKGWAYQADAPADPTVAFDPYAIGGQVNRGRGTARQVRVTPHPELGAATVWISDEHPPEELTPWQQLEKLGPVPWRGPSSRRADDPVTVGVDVHGGPIKASGPAPNSVEHGGIAGATRQGKSTTMAVWIAELAFRPDVAIVLIDGAGVEFGPWAPRASMLFVGPDGARDGVATMHRFMLERLERVRKLGRRTAPLGPGWPRVVIFIDEIAAFADNRSKEGREAAAHLTALSEQAGKVGIQLVLATQRPETGVWEGRLRDNLLTRIGHRHSSGEGSKMTTGPGGPDLTSIPKTLKGSFYVFSDADWRPGRSLLLVPRKAPPADERDEALAYAAAEIAAATKHLRIPKGEM